MYISNYSALLCSYRRLALKFHPDKDPSADAKKAFARIAEAYDVLSDGTLHSYYVMLRNLPEVYIDWQP